MPTAAGVETYLVRVLIGYFDELLIKWREGIFATYANITTFIAHIIPITITRLTARRFDAGIRTGLDLVPQVQRRHQFANLPDAGIAAHGVQSGHGFAEQSISIGGTTAANVGKGPIAGTVGGVIQHLGNAGHGSGEDEPLLAHGHAGRTASGQMRQVGRLDHLLLRWLGRVGTGLLVIWGQSSIVFVDGGIGRIFFTIRVILLRLPLLLAFFFFLIGRHLDNKSTSAPTKPRHGHHPAVQMRRPHQIPEHRLGPDGIIQRHVLGQNGRHRRHHLLHLRGIALVEPDREASGGGALIFVDDGSAAVQVRGLPQTVENDGVSGVEVVLVRTHYSIGL